VSDHEAQSRRLLIQSVNRVFPASSFSGVTRDFTNYPDPAVCKTSFGRF